MVILCYIRILLFFDCFSQGSVATRCRYGGKYNTDLVANLLLSPTVKEFKKIGQYLSKLWMNTEWHVFMAHGVHYRHHHHISLLTKLSYATQLQGCGYD